ncbi:hypothetical protein ABPG72_009094 [Tetrahymena utriculariae]
MKGNKNFKAKTTSNYYVVFILFIMISVTQQVSIQKSQYYINSQITLQDQQIIFLEELRQKIYCDDSKNQCNNGGQCVSNQCYCPSPYIGPYCQYYLDIGTYVQSWIGFAICATFLILGFVGTYFYLQYSYKKQRHDILKNDHYREYEIWERAKNTQRQQNIRSLQQISSESTVT